VHRPGPSTGSNRVLPENRYSTARPAMDVLGVAGESCDPESRPEPGAALPTELPPCGGRDSNPRPAHLQWRTGARRPATAANHTPVGPAVELDFTAVADCPPPRVSPRDPPPNEARHAGDGEGDLAVLGRIDEALVDEVLRISTKVCRTRNDFGESLP